MNHDKTFYSPAEREQLEQELLELHFGCHENPERIAARLEAEPALRALQAEVLQQARLLERAVRPEQPPLVLRTPSASSLRSRWLRRPAGRLLTAAALAAATVLGFFVADQIAQRRVASFECDHLHLTVSAPKAVPAGAPWSFTVQAQDLRGDPAACRVRWQSFGDNDAVLAADEVAVTGGAATIAMKANLRAPKRVEVVASHATDEVRQVFNLSTAHAGPLVHLTTDRPVYQPGEPVFARAVVLDRVTLLPLERQLPMQAQLFDSKGAPVSIDNEAVAPAGVGSFRLNLPADSAGGPHRVAVSSADGSFPTESAEIVVRTFHAPQLKKTIVLDRTTYAPGARGSATVTVERMGGGGAAGAIARAALVIDGAEVWTEQKALAAQGESTFRFTVPSNVDKGAARFCAMITDGGVVETEVKPFVVPTGKVLVSAYPEGGELVAGVENGLYLECSDPLGRPVDAAGELFDERGQVAKFRTAHQGRVKLTFVPRESSTYRVRLAGHEEPFEMPRVQSTGIAMRLPGTDIAANAPLRLDLAGRGDGPWLLGVFCRGVLVGQTTLRAGEGGDLLEPAEVTLPANAAGVLRATVFDRNLQPVAERLVRRAATHRIDIELASKLETLAPAESQQVTVRTKDESGKSMAAVVGLSVTDLAAVSLGSEPRVGLGDQAMLFADVERIENLGDFFPSNAEAARNVDLLLGTRGWRRFVWRNDDVAKAAIAAHARAGEGTLAREGFSHTPQVASNLAAAQASGAALASAAHQTGLRLHDAAVVAAILLGLVMLIEAIVWLMQRVLRVPPAWQLVVGVAAGVALVLLAVTSTHHVHEKLMWKADRDVLLDAVDFAGRDGAALPLVAPPVPEAAPARLFFAAHYGEADAFAKDGGLAVGGAMPAPLGFMVFEEANELVRGGGGGGAGRLEEGERRVAFHRADFKAKSHRYAVDWQQRQYAHKQTPHDGRTDFTSTICWNTFVATDANGEATVTFATSDAVTTWLVQADAHAPTGPTGRVGQAEAKFQARLPFHLEAKLPDEVSQGDLLQLPIAAIVEGQSIAEVALQATAANGAQLGANVPASIVLRDGRGRVLLPITVGEGTAAKLTLQGRAGRFADLVEHTLRIAPRGFPHHRSAGGTVEAGKPSTFVVVVPADAVPGSGHMTLKVYPSPLTALTEGLAGILQEPHGCFEQASSSNYPNTLVLTLLDANGDDVPAVAARARELLPRGYAKITGYECKQRGYEWFGGDPGHEALTAYGLLQFHDMAKVYAVDAGMVDRTKQWLLARRDGKGSFSRNARALDSYGGAPQELTDAYVVYALLQAGTPASELKTEIDALAGRITTRDPYEMALIACAMQLAGRPEVATARQRLAEMQGPDGSLHGAKTSITRSGGQDLIVETTGFSVLAWLPDAAYQNQVRSAVEFLQKCRGGSGTFGATQATIVALRALTEYAAKNRTMREPGTLRVFDGESMIAERAFTAGEVDALTFDLWNKLQHGEHTLRVEVTGGGSALPYACDVSYHAEQPADDPDTKVSIATSLRAATVTEGNTVALDVEVKNRTAEGQPMTLAIIGLPAGVELPTRVLEDLQKAEAFAFWELKGRELALYWRDLAPEASKKLTLDLVARIPGQSTGPASRTYLYYTPQQKRWQAPLRIDVTPAK